MKRKKENNSPDRNRHKTNDKKNARLGSVLPGPESERFSHPDDTWSIASLIKGINLNAILIFLALTAYTLASGQNAATTFTTDSVDLQQVMKAVLETHPSILKATEAIHAAEAGIGLAKSSWYPDVDLGGSYTRIGPIPSISIPNMGSFDMAPANNYNTALNVRQTLYDFSKTKTSVQVAESNKEITEKNVELVRQRLAILTLTNFYTMAYLQEAVHIRETQLKILEQHLDFITRKKETGSATDYEILSTKVRISNARNLKMDLETALDNQSAVLNSLLGLPENTRIKIRNRLAEQTMSTTYDSLVSYAFSHRTELILNDLREKQAELRLKSVQLDVNPVISAYASGGIKNGYFPDLNQPKANYSAGLAFKVPIYTATRHRNQLQLASSDIISIQKDIEVNRRDISSEVFQNVSNLQSSRRRIDQSELQLLQAEEARKLADLSFKSGSLTNLDLLDSESMEAESQLNLIRARIDYMVNAAKLDISVGKPGY